jgi:hypothetical protein
VTIESKATLLELGLFAAPPPGGGKGGVVLVLVVEALLEETEEVLRRGFVSEVEVALFLALVVRREAAVGLGAVDVVEALGANAPSSSIGSNVRRVYLECQIPTKTSNHQ